MGRDFEGGLYWCCNGVTRIPNQGPIPGDHRIYGGLMVHMSHCVIIGNHQVFVHSYHSPKKTYLHPPNLNETFGSYNLLGLKQEVHLIPKEGTDPRLRSHCALDLLAPNSKSLQSKPWALGVEPPSKNPDTLTLFVGPYCEPMRNHVGRHSLQFWI